MGGVNVSSLKIGYVNTTHSVHAIDAVDYFTREITDMM